MNRFLSKLDLRDIRIDPEGSRFPPDGDDFVEESAATGEKAPEGVETIIDSANGDELEPINMESATQWVNTPVTAPPPAPNAIPAPAPESASRGAKAAAAGDIDGVIGGADGEVLKVSARSRPSAVAGAIAGVVRLEGRAEVQAIGAGATNQAVKAVAIAREYLRESGIDAVCLPAFIDVTIENEDRTAIRIVVEPR